MGSDHDPWKAGVGGDARCLVEVKKDGDGWLLQRGAVTERRREGGNLGESTEGMKVVGNA